MNTTDNNEQLEQNKHTGTWLGHPPTGRRFTDIAEGYIFHFRHGHITNAWGLEDTYTRIHQLDLDAT